MGGQGSADLVFGTYLGGGLYDHARGVAVSASGQAVVVGWTFSTDFPTTAGAYDTMASGKGDAFLAILSPDGTGLDYATLLGGRGHDAAMRVASSGSDYLIGGVTWSSDFPTTAGVVQRSLGGASDAFVARLRPQGQGGADLAWSTLYGGSSPEVLLDLALDEAGGVNLGGFTRSLDLPTTNDASEPTPLTLNGRQDGFFARLRSDGRQLLHATYVRSEGGVTVGAIALEGLGAAVLAGEASAGIGFQTTPAVLSPTRVGGEYEAFVRRILVPQDVESDLSPDRVAVLPGELIAIQVTVTNNSPSSQVIRGKLDLFEAIGGAVPGNPVFGPVTRLVPGGRTARKEIRYTVPPGLPPGCYSLRLSLLRGSELLSLSSFAFEVNP
jgi:hypothetical protein